MTSFKHVAVEEGDGILTITVNRPDKLNAINSQSLEELKYAIELAYDKQSIRGVILTGAGEKAFVSGADIKELLEINEVNARKYSEKGQEVLSLFENCTKPVIALVNGYALGGGFELALACHMRIATGNANFGMPEASLGIIPGYGGTQRLTHLVGKGRALELMMSCESIDAKTAWDYGIVNHLVSDKSAGYLKCSEILNKIIRNAPLSIGKIVDCVNAVYSTEENGYLLEANSFASSCKTDDFKEGTNAFLEKRNPKFKGE